MYKFRKKILNEQLEKIQEELSEKKQELKEVTDILDDISTYESLTSNNFNINLIAFIILLIALILGYFSILAIAHSLIGTASGIGLISGLFLGFDYYIYKDIIFELRKEIKKLKTNGVKKLKKKKEELLTKKKEISKECDSIENKKADIQEELDNIAYYDRTSNDCLYQADSEEEYEQRKKYAQEYLKLLDDFLSEKVDYSKVQFNSTVGNEVKLEKKYNNLIKK